MAVTIVGIGDDINELKINGNALNSSLMELNSRVTTLEELNITIRSIIESIEDLELKDLELNTEINNLGLRTGEFELNGTVAFNANLGSYTSIPLDSIVVYPDVWINLGNGYNKSTGEFIVPDGGAGLYYLEVHLLVETGEITRFDMRHNGVTVCSARSDENSSANERSEVSCGTVAILKDGK